MKKIPWMALSIVLLLIAIGSLAANLWFWRSHTQYLSQNPVSVEPSTTRCPAQGLVAHWTMDAVNGQLINDDSPLGHHARMAVLPGPLADRRHPAVQLAPGRMMHAASFQGRQWLAAGNSDCFNAEAITVAAWVWQEDDVGIVPTIAAKSAWPFSGWWLCTTSEGSHGPDKRMLDFGISWGRSHTHVRSGYQLPLREWHHVVAMLDNTRQEAAFYVDGQLQGQVHTNVPKWLVNWDKELFVGEYDGSGRWPWRGKLDDVRIYNTPLTADAVKAIYQAAPPVAK